LIVIDVSTHVTERTPGYGTTTTLAARKLDVLLQRLAFDNLRVAEWQCLLRRPEPRSTLMLSSLANGVVPPASARACSTVSCGFITKHAGLVDLADHVDSVS